MADNDRYRTNYGRSRDDRERDRGEDAFRRGRGDAHPRSGDYGHRDDDGNIARRGFGNERSGFDRDRSAGGRDDDRYAGRERDFGDSAGYGTGGSARDWRDVMGEDRNRGGQEYGGDDNRGQDRGRGAGPSFFGADERGNRGGREDDRNRYGASDFGRGSRGEYGERGFIERAGDEIRSWFGDDDAERRRMRDSREGDAGAQHHRGRGPKNYSRSDERIREDVNDRLTDDPHIDASEIEVSVQDREVTLSGTVDSRFEKRHAEDIAESVSGVNHVQNNLRVQARSDTGAPPTSFASQNDSMGSEQGPASASGSARSTGSPLLGNATGPGRRSSST